MYKVKTWNTSGFRQFVSKDPPFQPGPNDAREMHDTQRTAFKVRPQRDDQKRPVFVLSPDGSTCPEGDLWASQYFFPKIFLLSEEGINRPKQDRGVDHFYTTNADEAQRAAKWMYASSEGQAGWVHPTQVEGTVPLYRFNNPTAMDHFYTQRSDCEGAWESYDEEGIACYVYATQYPNTVPLNRYRSTNPGQGVNHFYTINDEKVESMGYVHEGVAGYIYGQPTAGTVPFLRLRLARNQA